ncbi:MAG: AbrB/MazE/SpoVT family DNA-binding domain-containing protein [Propionibacteriaceae bacterium]|nr:AbrB/MazE/SpoVT family DNA-binding domain-containing protein [Propionibacteriaceae bacterium]
MNLAKLSSNGQITVPVEVRRRLRLSPGDKILFVERPSGEIVMANAALAALAEAQEVFSSVKDAFSDEEDVQQFVDELRGRSH